MEEEKEKKESGPELSGRGFFQWIAQKLGIPIWGQFLFYFLFACAAAFWLEVAHVRSSLEDHLGSLQSSVDNHISGLDKQMGGLNLAVYVIATQQPQAIREIIQRDLDQAQLEIKAGKTDGATDSVIRAGTVVELANGAKIQLPFDKVKEWQDQVMTIEQSSNDTSLLSAAKITSMNLSVYMQDSSSHTSVSK
jgi:hypothetical protein